VQLLISMLVTALALPGHAPKDGRDLVRAMHERYAGAWYHTLAFTQHNTATDSAGNETHSTWREYAALPGELRIDFLPADSGGGLLFRADSLYVFAHDALVRSAPFVHPLMVLGFDVYLEPVETTVAKLAGLGFDLSRMHEDSWEGRPVYVVGAAAGDSTSAQFWVDRERLVFVRMLQPGRRDPSRIAETRFEDYRPVGAAWVSARVRLLQDHRSVWLEEYAQIRTDLPLDPALFDPASFVRARPGD
jgi:hypothetical protein